MQDRDIGAGVASARRTPAYGEAVPREVRETTQVWRGPTGGVAFGPTPPPIPADAVRRMPLAELPVRRDVERTMIIRRPVRRARFDWRVPVRIAAPALMLGAMLALADWSERHPVNHPSAASPTAADNPSTVPPTPPSSRAVVEVLSDSATASPADPSSPAWLERTGRRAAKAGTLGRSDVNHAGTKPRTRPSSHRGATPSTRGGQRPPASKTDEETSSSGEAAVAHAPRARPANGRGSTLASSSTWVDPFAY